MRKVKLTTAIIGISSIHVLKTFINAANYSDGVLIAQTAIHIAATNRIVLPGEKLS